MVCSDTYFTFEQKCSMKHDDIFTIDDSLMSILVKCSRLSIDILSS